MTKNANNRFGNFLIIFIYLYFRCRNIKAHENEANKKTPKKSTGRMKIGQVFKKTPTKENGGNLFGVPLNRICDGENLPKPVKVSIRAGLDSRFYFGPQWIF